MCLPPPPKLERQLTESKWEDAEETMKKDPSRKEMVVSRSGHHTYKVVREGNSILRLYGNEWCLQCSRYDVRYPQYVKVYSVCGFLCGKCASSK